MTEIQIDVELACPGPAYIVFGGDVQIRSSATESDQVLITSRKIIASLQRASIASDPFKAHNSTFVKLIIKSLALYYTLTCRPSRIQRITWQRVDAFGGSGQKFDISPQIVQVLSQRTDLSLLKSVDPINAGLLMEETERGRAVLYAVTHLIKALDSKGPFERFDRLWRAFNSLYKAFARSTKDSVCHIALARDIRANPGKYPLATAKASALAKVEIRKNTRWNLMLQNNYPTAPRTKALKDAIIRTTDSRILGIYRDTLSTRSTFLAAEGHLTNVNAHLSADLVTPNVNDSDVITTLCIKYMYFVRNKIAHAERTDAGFAFFRGGDEEKEIAWLTPMLEALIVDMINISDTF